MYAFEGADFLAQFTVGIVAVLAGGGIIGWQIFAADWWLNVLLCALALLALVLGLRASIAVFEHETVIVKKWFFIPYRTYRAAWIGDVWYGGDWGLEEGAEGVVVRMGGKEIHIGSARTMRALYAALRPLSHEGRMAHANSLHAAEEHAGRAV